MYNDERPARRFYAVSYEEDIARVERGVLIPKKRTVEASVPVPPSAPVVLVEVWQRVRPIVLVTIPLFLFLVFGGLTGYSMLTAQSSVAAPIVVIENPDTKELAPLNYGIKLELSQPDFFQETHAAFVDNQLSFVEVDLTAMKIAYFLNGEEVFQAPILAKGKEGSWWETPAGLYEISYKAENHFSSFGQVYQPYSMAFQGNFFIHGWPHYPDGTPVASSFSGGCVRLSNEDAATLYTLTDPGTPILVHEAAFEGDDFLYETKVPELTAPHYLIADINNNTVLAASDVNGTAPIASITKLMTALIAAEYINLDKDVWKTQETFVQSLIPRLSGRSRVSMYSLLQLLLVESSNEAAEMIAAQLGRERFIALMNEKAKSLGLTDTVFTDPSGLHEGNISSLKDLLRLVQYIHHNRSFIIELTANQNLPTAYKSGEFGELMNFNEIKEIDNFIGGKVGETNAAGQTSVSLHKMSFNGEERIIAIIILGSESRSEDVVKLIGFVERRFGD